MTDIFAHLSVTTALWVVGACVLSIVVFGTMLTNTADQLADRTGLGEAIAGGILLGSVTSLPGIVVSVSAGLRGSPDLALGNAIGGIAAQTLFLAVADLFYTRANLEHAAASLTNMLQGALLIVLLAILGLGRYLPDVTLLGAHPSSWLLLMSYGYGLRVIAQVRKNPMWSPRSTDETRSDEPEDESELPSLKRLWLRFAPLALVLGVTGWVLESSIGTVIEHSSLNASVAGLLLTSTCTSLPELITSVAAVRKGALTLAVGGIVGGNTFDTLFAAAADFAYQKGSLYHNSSNQVNSWILLSILMIAVLVMGFLRREKYGVAKIGVESVAIIAFYLIGVITLAAPP